MSGFITNGELRIIARLLCLTLDKLCGLDEIRARMEGEE